MDLILNEDIMNNVIIKEIKYNLILIFYEELKYIKPQYIFAI